MFLSSQRWVTVAVSLDKALYPCASRHSGVNEYLIGLYSRRELKWQVDGQVYSDQVVKCKVGR